MGLVFSWFWLWLVSYASCALDILVTNNSGSRNRRVGGDGEYYRSEISDGIKLVNFSRPVQDCVLFSTSIVEQLLPAVN